MPEEYSNPTIPEGINTSERHPLRRFFVQGAQAIGVFAALVFTLAVLASLLAPHLPFSWERRLVQTLDSSAFAAEPSGDVEKELRRVAAKVAAAMDLPEGMNIQVKYDEGDIVNAFAGPGGIVVVFRGLLEELESEDELAALLAHEIAHVQHRDVVRGTVVALGMALLFAAVEPVAPVLSLMQQAGARSFSRTQESAADLAAAAALSRLYGHAEGAVRLFERIRAHEGSDVPLEIMASHPAFDTRIASVRGRCAALPACAASGTLTPLPAALAAVRTQAKEKTREEACKD